MSVCYEENAEDLNQTMGSMGLWITFIGYVLRLLASLSVTAYLYCTREKRHFPKYIKFQLALILAEYLLATGTTAWTLVVKSQGGPENAQSGSIYITVTYQTNNFQNLMYLYYNWLYVCQYLKAALFLPILLTARQYDGRVEDYEQLLEGKRLKLRRINLIWNLSCLLVLCTCFAVAFKYDDEQVFAGNVIQDVLFFLLAAYFVSFFFYSVRQIKQAIHKVKQLRNYMDERIIFLQLVVFSVYLAVDLCYTIVMEQTLKENIDEVKKCQLSIAGLIFQISDTIIKIVVLTIILVMIIRQSQIIIDQGDDKVQKQLFAHVDINNAGHRELDKIEDRRESENAAKKRATHLNDLANDVIRFTLAQVRKERINGATNEILRTSSLRSIHENRASIGTRDSHSSAPLSEDSMQDLLQNQIDQSISSDAQDEISDQQMEDVLYDQVRKTMSQTISVANSFSSSN